MPSVFSKFTSKRSSDKASRGKGAEPTYSIQPHPAKTNDPNDLNKREPGGGLASNPGTAFDHAPGPVMPNAQMQGNIGAPKTRDELRARAAELNK